MLFYFIPGIYRAPLTRVCHESGHALILCSVNHFPDLFFLTALSAFLKHPPVTAIEFHSPPAAQGGTTAFMPQWDDCQRQLSKNGLVGTTQVQRGPQETGRWSSHSFLSTLAAFYVAWWKDDRPRDHEGQVLAPQLPTVWPRASVSSSVNHRTGLWGKLWFTLGVALGDEAPQAEL